MTDWFRKATWTSEDRADFEQRLARARKASRAQYLRIQAAHLAEHGWHDEALSLIDRMLSDYPEQVQIAPALAQKAVSLEEVGEIEDAVAAFRAALEQERRFPNVRTRALFGLPALVARHRLRAYFEEALDLLQVAESEQMFPVDRFLVAASRAVIASEMGNKLEARSQADLARLAAVEDHSGISRHPQIGLVPLNEPLLRAIESLSG